MGTAPDSVAPHRGQRRSGDRGLRAQGAAVGGATLLASALIGADVLIAFPHGSDRTGPSAYELPQRPEGAAGDGARRGATRPAGATIGARQCSCGRRHMQASAGE